MNDVNRAMKPYFEKGYWKKPLKPIFCEILRKTSTRNMVRECLWQINFSEFRIDLSFWEIAVKKATEISWGPRTFYKPCLLTHTKNLHVGVHCSVLPTFGCDTLVPPCPKQVFPRSGPAYNVFMNINSYSTTHTPCSGQENTTFIVFYL
jgi:hypothetical protein